MFARLMLSTMRKKLSGIRKYCRRSKMILTLWFSMRFLISMRSSLLDYRRRMQSIRLSIINSKCLLRNSSSISRSNPSVFWASKRIYLIREIIKNKWLLSYFFWMRQIKYLFKDSCKQINRSSFLFVDRVNIQVESGNDILKVLQIACKESENISMIACLCKHITRYFESPQIFNRVNGFISHPLAYEQLKSKYFVFCCCCYWEMNDWIIYCGFVVVVGQIYQELKKSLMLWVTSTQWRSSRLIKYSNSIKNNKKQLHKKEN